MSATFFLKVCRRELMAENEAFLMHLHRVRLQKSITGFELASATAEPQCP